MNLFKTLLTFTLGAAAGLSAGYLTAPRSGEKTRKKLSKEFDTTKGALEEAATQKLDEAKSLLNQQVESQAKKGKEAIDKMSKAVKMS